GVSRDEGADPPRLDGRQRPGRDDKGDEQRQHNSKGEPALRQARRQVRENEMLFLWCSSWRVRHRSRPLGARARATDLIGRRGNSHGAAPLEVAFILLLGAAGDKTRRIADERLPHLSAEGKGRTVAIIFGSGADQRKPQQAIARSSKRSLEAGNRCY